MSLTAELIKKLDDTNEPPAKRLKLADNIFKSSEIPIHRREALLFRWLKTQLLGNDGVVWNLWKTWLSSEQFKELNKNDFSFHDYESVIEVFPASLSTCKDKNVTSIIIDCAILLISSKTFMHQMRTNPKKYFEFVIGIVKGTNEESELLKFIDNQHLFDETIILHEMFSKNFVEKFLPVMVSCCYSFKETDAVFDAFSKIIGKCVFKKRSQMFRDNFNESSKETVPMLLYNHIKSTYHSNNSEACLNFRILFDAVCKSYPDDFSLVYQFFATMVKMLQSEDNVDKSLAILRDLLKILSMTKINLEDKVGDTSFGDFLKGILSWILNTPCTTTTHEIICFAIVINPLVIEPVIEKLLVYLMLNARIEDRSYENVLVSIFDIFSKLHRIQTLVSKMVRSLKDALADTKVNVPTVEAMLPSAVTEYYSRCIISLASWQHMNLYKTLLFHLTEAINDDLSKCGDDFRKVLYVNVLCTLLSQFLLSVRIAEHTVSPSIVSRFVETMEELRGLLSKFGTSLVKMEHNHTLMQSYLNLCYMWGELYIILSHYSLNDDVKLVKVIDTDYSACNITYLHSYLSIEQWCLISQRITNFGEKPCKQIMQSLYLQKLRAMIIFEHNVPEEVHLSIIKNLMTHSKDLCNHLVINRFLARAIISKADETAKVSLAKHVIKDLHWLETVADCEDLLGPLMHACMIKISKLFKTKRKHVNLMSSNVLEMYIKKESLAGFTGMAKTNLINNLEGHNAEDFQMNTAKLLQCLEIVKRLPIPNLDQNTQTVCVAYFLALLIDLHNINFEEKGAFSIIENIIVDICKHSFVVLPEICEMDVLFEIIINKMSNFTAMLDCLLETTLKYEAHIKSLKSIVHTIISDLQDTVRLKCCVQILQFIRKCKKIKLTPSSKDLLEELKDEIGAVLLNKSDLASPEAFVLAYRVCGIYNNDELFKKIADKWLNAASIQATDVRGWCLLYGILLQEKQFHHLIDDVYILRVWNKLISLVPNEEDKVPYSELIRVVLEHVSNETFSIIINNVLEETEKSISKRDLTLYRRYTKIWTSGLYCSFNVVKMKTLQKVIQSYLLFHCQESSSDFDDAFWNIFINFEIVLVQSVKLILSSSTVDLILIATSNLIRSKTEFYMRFKQSILIVESLVKYRKATISDWLPSYLQRYRLLIRVLCQESGSNLNHDAEKLQERSDCAHRLEMLTKRLVGFKKHMASVAKFVIADILQQYETVTLYPNVKIHLDNCLYILIGMCDEHAIAYLMRVLSTSSAEIFKLLYQTYKKYYKFTGKV